MNSGFRKRPLEDVTSRFDLCVDHSTADGLGARLFQLSLNMDKAALVQTLVMSEKNHSIVTIKIINHSKPIVGAVQKVLNQIIILKSAAQEPITLTFADIESVQGSPKSVFRVLLENVAKTVHSSLRWH